MDTISNPNDRRIYWHRDLPPCDGELMGEHVLEASSARVRGSLARRGELWECAFHALMDNAEERMNQEIRRRGGHYAHVLSESIGSRHDDATGEEWLHGLFTYALYRRAPPSTGTHDTAE